MKKYGNFGLSSLLGLSHFLTDALAAFVLTSIVLQLGKTSGTLQGYFSLDAVSYFFLYNFFAFFLQIFLGYFFDTVKNDTQFFRISKISVLVSFGFYIAGVLFLYIHFLTSVILTGIGSCLLHLGSGNIALSSRSRKATHLGIFASGGVIGLSFGGFIALSFPSIVFGILGVLFGIGAYIAGEKNYTIDIGETSSKHSSTQDIFPFIIVGLGILLIARSAIWTHFQQVFSGNTSMLLYIASAAFLGKIVGGFVKDMPKFKETYLWSIGGATLTSLALYSYISQSIYFLLLGIFGIQFFVSPLTYILYTYLKEWKSTIIGFTFGCSLVLGYLLINGHL